MPPIEQVNFNTLLLAIIAAIVTLVTPLITAWVTITVQRAARAEDRADRIATNSKVDEIKKTGEATHAIVNNQRTQMLRQLAFLARTLAVAFPDNPAYQKAAADADLDLAENERVNAAAYAAGK